MLLTWMHPSGLDANMLSPLVGRITNPYVGRLELSAMARGMQRMSDGVASVSILSLVILLYVEPWLAFAVLALWLGWIQIGSL